jgi:replicative DNA helicase
MNRTNLNYANELAEKQIIAWMWFVREFVDIPECYFTKSDLLEIYKCYRKQYFEHGEFISEMVPDGTQAALSDAGEVSTSARPDTIIMELKKAYLVREYYKILIETDRDLDADKSNILHILEKNNSSITKMLTEIEESKEYNHQRSVFDYLLKVEEAKKSGKKIRGICSHLPDLDKIISGWEKGKVYLVSGLEKLGKSRFVRDLTSTWLKAGYGCIIFLLEEDAESIHECILANRATINTDTMGTAMLSDYGMKNICSEGQKYMDEPLYISCKSGINPSYVKNIVLKQKVKMQNINKSLDFIIIDYVQRMTASGDGAHEKTENIASELANIARDEKVCMIEVSQMSSGAEKQKGLPLHTQIRFGKVFKEAAHCIITFDDPERMKRNTDDDSNAFLTGDMAHKIITAHIIQRKGQSDITLALRAQLQFSSFNNIVSGDYEK